MTDTILGGLILLPLLLTFLLKSNAALGFLALCVGFVLSTSVIGDLKELLNQMDLSVTDTTLAILLIALPFVLTLLLARKSSGHGLRFWLQLLAAVGAGGLLALSIGPLLNSYSQVNLFDSKIWDVLQETQAGIIGVGALLSLCLVWLGSSKHTDKKKHK